MIDRETIESKLNYAKGEVIKFEKELDKSDKPSKNNYYWGGYVAALNYVLGIVE